MPGASDRIPAKLIYSALRRLLRPLVKLLISHGVVFPALVELLRSLYVDVAREDFVVEGKGQTLSRINIMTGITRREVKRLLDMEQEEDDVPQSLSLGARILTVWLGDDDYLDRWKQPLPLPLTAPDDAPSLERLVASVSKDVRARAVLDEWLRQGIVDMSGYVVRLQTTAFIPKDGFDEKIYYFGRNLRDHIAAGVHNIEAQADELPFFDRAVYYDKLSPQSIEELRSYVHEHGAQFVLKINRRARTLADKDAAADDDRLTGRMSLGVYFFAEDEKPSESETHP